MSGKIKGMVATAPTSKRRPGRPRQFAESRACMIVLPLDLHRAAERHQRDRKLSGFSEAVRDLLREAAEARNLVR